MKKPYSLNGALDIVGLTDTGKVREHNEDAMAFDTDLGFVILADGMGGYSAGEVASSIAVEEVCKVLGDVVATTPLHERSPSMPWPTSHTLMRSAVELANSAVYSTALRNVRYNGMGTTLVVGLFYDNKLLLAHVGDSRAYRFRDGELMQLTRDHSILQEQIAAGLITPEAASQSSFRNLVTRAVGTEPEVLAEIQEYQTLPQDIYLFCSDGLTNMLEHARLTEILATHKPGQVLPVCELVDAANTAGGTDNVSVVLVRVLHDYRTSRSWLARFFGLFY